MPGKRLHTSCWWCIATASLAVFFCWGEVRAEGEGEEQSQKFKIQREKRQYEQYLTSPPPNLGNHDSQCKGKSKRQEISYQVTRHSTRVCMDKPCPARCWAWIIHGNSSVIPGSDCSAGPWMSHDSDRPCTTATGPAEPGFLSMATGRGSGRNVG